MARGDIIAMVMLGLWRHYGFGDIRVVVTLGLWALGLCDIKAMWILGP